MAGEGTFLITFSPPNIEAAHSPDQMFSHAKLKKKLGMLSMEGVEKFIESGEYHKSRGEYVFNKIKHNHAEFEALLLHYVQKSDILSSIPISNTFLVKASKGQIRGLVNVPASIRPMAS